MPRCRDRNRNPGALLATNLTVHAFPVSHGTFCMSSTALASRRRSSVARLSVSATRRNQGVAQRRFCAKERVLVFPTV